MVFSETADLICLARKCQKANYQRKKYEHLIKLVRGHTLYNPRVPEHKDAQLTLNTWRSIAKILAVGKFGGKYKIHGPCILYIFTLKQFML